MQLKLAFLEEPKPRQTQSEGPWNQIDPGARAMALEILSRLIAQMLAARTAKEASHD
ncbi:hypothetical protein [Microvirga tunisiensis]|jgi:hypothetical protein|uniref:hypothetical protein n=1 Tax=Microvirga tunisiensis TaxID=2108360 RepID=UPI00129D16BB|nr:hypothetical protein [Microvirga tunisiensis]